MNKDTGNDRILEDGEVLVVPMHMMTDSSAPRGPAASQITPGLALNRPGPVALSDAERAQRRVVLDKVDARLENAWKEPSPVLDAAKPPAKVTMSDAYAARDAKLSEAWRHA